MSIMATKKSGLHGLALEITTRDAAQAAGWNVMILDEVVGPREAWVCPSCNRFPPQQLALFELRD
jgi:hypothetical protein